MTTLSTTDNCIFYNALTKNTDPYDDADVILLQEFRGNQDESDIVNYYTRSTRLVQYLNQRPGNQRELWSDITVRFVKPILDEIRAGNYGDAMTKIQIMLEELEKGA